MGRKAARTYSPEFKQEALRLIGTEGSSIAQIVRELGVHVETLRLWRRAAERAAGADREGGEGASLEEENRRLRREIARLREEREILKQATAFFARGSG